MEVPQIQYVGKFIDVPIYVIKMNHVKKYLEMLAEIAELNDDHEKFYEQFVECMKLGIRDNSVDDLEIAELLRFITSKSGDEQISVKEYVDRMKEGRNDNYHITVRVSLLCSSRGNICTRRVMRYPTWLTPWMKMPCTSSRSSTERS